MKNFVNTEDLKAAFDAHPEIEFMLITEDGHMFLPKNAGYCKSHCELKKIKFEKITRDGSTPSEDEGELGLEVLSFNELKDMCAKINPEFTPKSKVKAIEFINENSATVDVVEPNPVDVEKGDEPTTEASDNKTENTAE
jgi:hypothetical protein